MLPSTLAKRGYLLLFLVIIAFYFYGLNFLPFVGPDEPRYAQVAREMFLRHDLITPTLGGHTWFEKPVLLYWMIIGSFQAFGVSEWAARLGPAFCGVITLIAVYWVGRRTEIISGDPDLRDLGWWSALILGTTPGMIVFARATSFDIVVTATVTWALSCFFLAELETDERRRKWYLVGFYACVGLSLLAKGLVGIVVPFGVIGLYWILRREFYRHWFFTSLVWGVPLAVLVAATWYAPVTVRHGWPFIDEFFVQHHFARYLSNKYNHPQPIFYYFAIIIPLAMPWVVLAIQSVTKLRQWNWRGTTPVERLRIFTFAWIVLPLIFFSFSRSKLPGYILPILPAIALLAAERLRRIIADKDRSRALQVMAGIMLIWGVGMIVYAYASGVLALGYAFVAAAPLLLTALIILLWPSHKTFASQVTVVAILLSFAFALKFGARISESHSVRQLIVAADERGYGAAPLYFVHEVERTAEFYAAGRVVYDVHGQPVKFEGPGPALKAAQQLKSPVLVILPLKHVDQVKNLKSASVEVISNNGVLAIAGIRASQ